MNWIWVACGGAIGASLRYALSLYLVKPQNLFPWPTWWINISGCVLAGIFFACTERYPILQQQTRLFLMVGILGGYTTFSSFGLETFLLLKQGHLMIALAYVISSVIVGVVGLAIGFYIFQMLLK